MGRYKLELEPSFKNYIENRFHEHHYSMKTHRSEAFWVRFTHPMVGCMLAGGPAFILALGTVLLYQSNKERLPDYHPRLAEVLTPETWAFLQGGLFGFAFFCALIGLTVGVVTGMSRARKHILDSEKLELDARLVWNLQQVVEAMHKDRGEKKTTTQSGGVHTPERPALSTALEQPQESGEEPRVA